MWLKMGTFCACHNSRQTPTHAKDKIEVNARISSKMTGIPLVALSAKTPPRSATTGTAYANAL
jgi:hypothetical protein